MKTLINKETRQNVGLRPSRKQEPQKLKTRSDHPLSGNMLPESLRAHNTRLKNSLQRVTKKQIYRRLRQLKSELEAYTGSDSFVAGLSFGYFLNQYIRRQNKLDKQFAVDIGVTHAAISQYLNDHRKPTKEFLVRLEIHSNNLIPAIVWFKLMQKEKEHEIITNTGIRTAESRYVNSLFTGKNWRAQGGRHTSC